MEKGLAEPQDIFGPLDASLVIDPLMHLSCSQSEMSEHGPN